MGSYGDVLVNCVQCGLRGKCVLDESLNRLRVRLRGGPFCDDCLKTVQQIQEDSDRAAAADPGEHHELPDGQPVGEDICCECGVALDGHNYPCECGHKQCGVCLNDDGEDTCLHCRDPRYVQGFNQGLRQGLRDAREGYERGYALGWGRGHERGYGTGYADRGRDELWEQRQEERLWEQRLAAPPHEVPVSSPPATPPRAQPASSSDGFAPPGNPMHFHWAPGTFHWQCLLCAKRATPEHIETKTHQDRVRHSTPTNFPDASNG